jgi:DNA repair ATPase RecN
MKMYKYDDDVAQATAEYERISRKIEGMMRHLDTWRAEIKRISALDPMPQEEYTKMSKYKASLKKHEPSRKTWARVVARKKQEVLDAVARAKAKGPPKKVPKAEKPGSPEFVQQLGKSV